jgi:membrane fusion protein, multidrug efflux system
MPAPPRSRPPRASPPDAASPDALSPEAPAPSAARPDTAPPAARRDGPRSDGERSDDERSDGERHDGEHHHGGRSDGARHDGDRGGGTTRDAEPALSAPKSRARRAWPWIIALVVLIAAAIGGWFYWGSTAPSEQAEKGRRFDPNARTMPVVAQPATKGSIDVYVSALGTVTPRNNVVVRSRVDGQLMKIHFNEGQLVKEGDVLAEIDPRPFQVQLAQATGQMAKDQALLNNAQVDLKRYRELLAQDSIERQKVDTQEALVRQYQGTVQSDQGGIESAKLQLTYSRITAPISGRVGLRQVDPGNVVRASDANGIVVITQLQPITVLFPIPEDNVPRVMGRLNSGQPIAVEAWDRDMKNKIETGKLVTIDNQIDTATGTVKLRAEFANANLGLFPNQFVNVRMLIETQTDATLVPSAAIQRGSPGTFVYVVRDDQTVSVVPVKLGPVQGETTAIASGLTPGQNVVVDGADKLREGSKVELITRDQQGAAQGARQGGAPEQGKRGQRGDKGGGGQWKKGEKGGG